MLNAGWSSQPGKEAVTLFDDMRLGLNEFDIHLYRYELVNNKLANSKSLLNIPLLSPEFNHYGGKILIGPDRDLYIAVGNAGNINATIQNIPSGKIPDGTGGILRLIQDGKPVGKGIIGDNYPLNLYYAYGIRNSFGIGFDPVTGKLWDTENDDAFGDEINIVNPGFNSGYYKVQGIWKPEIITPGAREEEAGPITLHPEKHLVDFQGKGKYHAPELIWFHTVCPTAITFLNSAKLGEQYKNDMFVGDFNNGNLYHFKLNQNRTALLLSSSLVNKVASNNKDLQKLIFGDGFSAITDVKVGPDGYLYVLRFTDPGTIFRIVPKP